METDKRVFNNLAAAAAPNDDHVAASSFQSSNFAQSTLASSADRLSGNLAGNNSEPAIPDPLALQVEGTNDDSALMALGKQFEEIAAYLELLEAALGRLEPIELAIMTTPARTISGLGVKARHAAYVLSEYWDVPIDRIDWDARAVRLLIEAVCNVARVRLPRGQEPTT